jgi:APA family basic amino acid/polyamine antiporter
MIGATLLVALLYLALNGVMVYAGPHSQLAGQADIAAVAARLLGGTWGELACRLLIIAALVTSVSALTMSGPRVYAKMARDGLFPLPRENPLKAPLVAIWLQALLACVVVLSTTLRQQLNYLGFMLSICSAATVATLFLPQRGQRLRAYEAVAAGLYVVASFTFAALAARHQGNPAAIAAAATLALGLVAFALMRWWRPAGKRE